MNIVIERMEFRKLIHILKPHFIINLSEFIASTCTYIAFPLNLGLPYDKNFFKLECFEGLRFDIKWIDYKLHFHQNSLRDQMVNSELYTIIPGYAHKPLWSISEKLFNNMVKGMISFLISRVGNNDIHSYGQNFLPLDNKQFFLSNERDID